MNTISRALLVPALDMVSMVWRFRRLLTTTTRFELAKRYAASIMGLMWVFVYPVAFLGTYIFVFLVVFKAQVPKFTGVGYVAFLFTGMVPFLGFVDVLNQGVACIRQNMHLVKNVIMPIDLIPVRAVMVAMVAELAGLTVLLVLVAISGQASIKLLALPLLIVLQFLMFAGIAWAFGAFGVLLPDLNQIVPLTTTALFFISPVAFPPEMVPPALHWLLLINPVHYLIDAFRWSFLADYSANPINLITFVAASIIFFVVGAALFRRFKGFVVDYE